MPRARNIKPSFFKNEVLVDLPFETRLLFVGLWTLADREGRLQDRPKRIKMELFPADDCDVDSMLQQLQGAGFIVRYGTCTGQARCKHQAEYIQILSFTKHQNPHKAEQPSTIPAPKDVEDEQGKHGAPTVDAGLIPDPGILNPEVTNPDGLVVPGDAGDGSEPTTLKPEKTGTPPCPHQEIIKLYHEILPANPPIREWTPARQTHLRARWNEDSRRQNLDYWRRFFERIAEHCPFLTGQRPGKNGQPFLPGLDWMVKQGNFVKIREGNYVEGQAA